MVVVAQDFLRWRSILQIDGYIFNFTFLITLTPTHHKRQKQKHTHTDVSFHDDQLKSESQLILILRGERPEAILI